MYSITEPGDKDKYISELVETNSALAMALTQTRKKMNKRNGEQALKWRNQAFYYKSKALKLEKKVKELLEGAGE